MTVTVSGGVLPYIYNWGDIGVGSSTRTNLAPVCTHNGNRCERLRSEHELYGRRRRDHAQPKRHGC
ncbi:MAG: hypothetical protein R2795_19560 [Saprospiraceae bacterium]